MKRRVDLFWAVYLPVLLFLPVVCAAQGIGDITQSDLGGRNSVAGMIFTPGGTPAGRGIRIRLSRVGAEVSSTSDEQGRFTIAGLSNGSYTLFIDPGDGYEQETQQVDISVPRGASAQTVHVSVQLRLKPGARARPAVVDAEMAGVPKNAIRHYEKAGSAAVKGDTKGAVEELLRAVEIHPDFVIAHSELGIQYQKLNELEKADEHLRIALRLKPDAYEPLANRGVVLVRMRKYADAEPLLRDALRLKDDSAVVHFYLGRSLLGQKRNDDAEAEFKTAFSQGGKDMIEARRALATIYLEKGENQKALVEIEAYLEGNPAASDAKQLQDTATKIKEWLKANQKP